MKKGKNIKKFKDFINENWNQSKIDQKNELDRMRDEINSVFQKEVDILNKEKADKKAKRMSSSNDDLNDTQNKNLEKSRKTLGKIGLS